MWADNLIAEYEDGRRDLGLMRNELGDTELDLADKTLISGMVSDMTYSINWLKIGREPGTFQGIDKRAAYQRQMYVDDMDLFPSLELEIKEELPDDKKRAIIDVLMILSARERQCFILRKSYVMSLGEIAIDLSISKSSVQTFLSRAESKIKKRMTKLS